MVFTSLTVAFAGFSLAAADEKAPAVVTFSVNDAATNTAVPCRIHLYDSSNKPVLPSGYPVWRDHFVCDGTAKVTVPAGEYRYEIERGPEYAAPGKKIVAKAGETTAVAESLRRIASLEQEGWFSGETHIHRPPADAELLMRAENLHIGAVISWWNDTNLWKDRPLPAKSIVQFDKNRFCDLLGGEDERAGGALMFSNLREPLPIVTQRREWTPQQTNRREWPPSVKWLAAGKDAGGWVDAEKPFWWDFPLWLASGRLDSVGIANNHMRRTEVGNLEAWGKPRDQQKFPDPYGNGLWTQEIYYQALNSGFRLPPSAGSASGVLFNPVGYNRVYAHVDGDLTWDKWWDAVRAGQVFATNGPLLRLKANDKLSGQVFRNSGPLDVVIDGKLDSRDPIGAVELVWNGMVETVTLPARVTIRQSGWFLVRARADVKHTFRFASTGPWYVEIGERPKRISKSACQFFLSWMDERIDKLKQAPMSDDERRDAMQVADGARQFWADRLRQANAD